VTLHRPSNVDEAGALKEILTALEAIERKLDIVFPVHPRTRARLNAFGLGPRLAAMRRLTLVDPLGYLDFLHLMAHAALVLTDSGGIQEETTYLQVPCLTLRENTERGVTVTHGTNALVGMRSQTIIDGADRALGTHERERRLPPLWDGRAAERIVAILVRKADGLKRTNA
jgi:UDP-N-acetylglucosamine 2-epimerase (non-hydrolysing)